MAKGLKLEIGLSTVIFFCVLVAGGVSPIAFLPLLAALLHEIGHIIVMLICGQKIARIKILPIGLDIKTAPCVSSYKADIAISIAGILANICVIMICSRFESTDTLNFFKISNMILILLNILPIRSLDGGQILEKTLELTTSPDTAERVMKTVSFFCLVLLWSFAVWIFFESNYNFTLLMMCIYLFVGIFVR